MLYRDIVKIAWPSLWDSFTTDFHGGYDDGRKAGGLCHIGSWAYQSAEVSTYDHVRAMSVGAGKIQRGR